MPPIHQKGPAQLNLDAPNPSKWSRTIGPQCLQEPGILEILETTHSKNKPSWQPLNQTSQLDSNPGSHSIKPGKWTAILAATQSNQSVNYGGRQADSEGGLGGWQPSQAGSDDADNVPTTLDIWRSPGPTCPGNKHPVREPLTSTNTLVPKGIEVKHFALKY